MTEADTCRQYVVPRLQSAGWEEDPHRISEQVTFTDGRIIPFSNRVRRGKEESRRLKNLGQAIQEK